MGWAVRRLVLLSLIVVLGIVLSPAARASDVNAADVNAASGLAVQGHDPVAYFTDGRPVKGDRRFQHDWNGVTWRFASAEHRDAFAAKPERFAPRYGGFCAYALAKGYRADIDPEAWTIVDDRLYLNYSKRVRNLWLQDVPGHIAAADQNWPNVK